VNLQDKVRRLERELRDYRSRAALFDRSIRSNDLREVGTDMFRHFFRFFGAYKGDITILTDYDERELFARFGWNPRGRMPLASELQDAARRQTKFLRGLVEEQIFIGYSTEKRQRILQTSLVEQSLLECLVSKSPRLVNDVPAELSARERAVAREQRTKAWLNWVVLHPENSKLLAKLHMSFRTTKRHTRDTFARRMRPFENLLRYRILHTRDFRRVKYLSERDVLTGFYLRSVLARRMAELLDEGGRRRSGMTLSVGMIDLDHFKRFNDQYGHAMGDRVLRQFSQAVQATVRDSDVVCRFGGEEFVVLFPDAPASAVLNIFRRVHRRLRETDLGLGSETLRFSAGVATVSLRPKGLRPSTDELLKAADDLLLRCKRGGRNRCCWRGLRGRVSESVFKS